MPSSVLTSDSREEVESALASKPRFTDPQTTALYNWCFRLLTALLAYVTYFIGYNSDEIQSLRERIEELESNVPAYAETVETSPQHPASHPSRSSRPTRCKRCHALGHDTNNCRSKDPVAIKKRVACNQKARKEAERRTQYQPPPPLPHTYAMPSHYVNPTISTIHPEYPAFTALAADARELRRRKVQSTRDKRRKGGTSTTTA